MFEKIKKMYSSLLKMERFTQSVSDKLSSLSEIDRKLDKLIKLNTMTDTDIEQAISKVRELSNNTLRIKATDKVVKYEPVKSLPQRRMEFFKKAFESEFIYSELEAKYQSEFNERTTNFYKTIREFGSLLGYRFERQDTSVTKYKPMKVNE